MLSKGAFSPYNGYVLFFAHTAITTGVVLNIDKVIIRRIISPGENDSSDGSLYASRLVEFANGIDYRLVMVASLLPDIIDKPLGIYIFPGTFGSGRIYAHTLLFLLLISIAGLFLYRKYHRTGFLIVPFCSGFHLVLDSMWDSTKTLFWPAEGWTFPSYETENWLSHLFDKAISDPSDYIPELIGMSIFLCIGVYMIISHRMTKFLTHGTI